MSTATEPAHHLDIPEERRAAAKVHIAMISKTVQQVARDLPLGADVDDFRRTLAAHAPKTVGRHD